MHVKSNKFQALKQEITLTKFCQIWFLLLHVGGFKLYMGNNAQIMTVSEMIIYMWVNKKTRGILCYGVCLSFNFTYFEQRIGFAQHLLN